MKFSKKRSAYLCPMFYCLDWVCEPSTARCRQYGPFLL